MHVRLLHASTVPFKFRTETVPWGFHNFINFVFIIWLLGMIGWHLGFQIRFARKKPCVPRAQNHAWLVKASSSNCSYIAASPVWRVAASQWSAHWFTGVCTSNPDLDLGTEHEGIPEACDSTTIPRSSCTRALQSHDLKWVTKRKPWPLWPNCLLITLWVVLQSFWGSLVWSLAPIARTCEPSPRKSLYYMVCEKCGSLRV